MSHLKSRSILLVCADFKPNAGGEAEVAYSLALALRDRGNRVTVLAPSDLPESPEDTTLRGSVRRQLELKRFRPLSSVSGWLVWPGAMASLVRTIRRTARAVSADVCLVTTYTSWPTLAVRLSRVPYGLFLHGEDVTIADWRGGWTKRLFLDACRSARRIFFNSEFSRGVLLRKIPELQAKTQAVGCGVRTAVKWTTDRRLEARRDLGFGAEAVLLTVATLHEKKGVQTVVRALKKIRASYPRLRYVVVGDGPYGDTLRAIVETEKVADHVSLVGRVDHETKEKLFAASDVYVMVSQPGIIGEEEGFGITFLEANWHGLPVVGSRCGGIPESVEDGVSGLLVEPGCPDGVATAILRLLGDADLRRDLVRGGRSRIQQRLNWPAIAERVDSGLFDHRDIHFADPERTCCGLSVGCGTRSCAVGQ